MCIFEDIQRSQNLNVAVDYIAKKKIQNDLHKIQQNIINSLMSLVQNHQMDLICSNRKLLFYSTFKTDPSSSIQLELIKNIKHRKS